MFDWLRGIGRRHEAKTVDIAKIARELWAGAETKAGARVSVASSLQVSTVLACVRVISEGIAQVPFKLFRVDGASRIEETTHPISDLIRSKPNELQSSYEFRETVGLHTVLTGNAYVALARSGRRIVELLPLDPTMTTVIRSPKAGARPSFSYRTQSGLITLGPDDVWHVKGPSWNTTSGMEIVALAREAIGLSMATEEHGGLMFSNGARPAGILTSAANLTPEKQAELRDAWAMQYGQGNSGKTAILSGGLQWQTVSMDAEASQFLETRRFQIEEICRAFRVMPIMVGFADKATTYASAEQMFMAHVVHTLAPWYARIEQSANLALLSDEDRRQGLYTKFVAQGLMRADSRSFAEYVSRMVLNGIMTRNEARALMELNPLDGLDDPMMPVNMTTSLEDQPSTTEGPKP